MNRAILCALIFNALMALSQSTAADSQSTDGGGTSLATLCNQTNHDQNNFEWSGCVLYVKGVAEGFDAAIITLAVLSGNKTLDPGVAKEIRAVADVLNHETCRHNGSTPEQTALVVVKYLADNPQNLHLDSNVLVMRAIEDAWPCPKNSGS